jgi:hypothetical protein
MSTTTSFPSGLGFVKDYIHDILGQHGFNQLPSADREKLMDEFTDQAIIRLTAGLSSELSKDGKKRFETMVASGNVADQEWLDFWQQEVPNVQTVSKEILTAFALELKQTLNS